MSVVFPANPPVDYVFTYGNRSWTWTGAYWRASSATIGYTGSKGESSYITSDNAPTNPLVGDRWYNSADALELVWTDDGESQQWVEVAASGFPGAAGYTGSKGIDGEYAGMGYTGSASTTPGYTGSIGIGLKGDVGFTGSASTVIGYSGSQGITGFTGSSGTTIPVTTKSSSYTLQITDNGNLVSISTGGVTVPSFIFAVGMNVTIFNNSTSTQTITQGTSATMYLAGSPVVTTGNRTLNPHGIATVICVSYNIFAITGAGVS
jgi:hypothetical protein